MSIMGNLMSYQSQAQPAPSRLVEQSRNGAALLKANQQSVRESGVKVTQRPERTYGSGQTVTRSNEPATQAQISFIETLLGKLDGHNPVRGTAARVALEDIGVQKLTKKQASNVIGTLKGHLADPASQAKTEARENTERRGPLPPAEEARQAVEDGRYAVEEDGELKFFKVNNGSGRWAGYVFIDIQASDDLYPIRDRARKERILALIAEDPYVAMIRYGHELGVCGRCARTLTDEASRAAGIGPICAAK